MIHFFLEDEYRDCLHDFIEYSQKDLTVYYDPTSPNPPHPLLLPDFKKDTLIGDGLKEYPKIAKSINMDFHPCVFHKLYVIILEISKHQNNILNKKETHENKKERNIKIIKKKSLFNKRKRGRIPIKDNKRRKAKDKITTLTIENHELDKKIRQLNKENEELEGYKNSIINIFNAETIKDAKRRFNTLYNKRQFLPDEFTKFLNNLKKRS